jgi:hypothetical protein
MEVVEEDEVGSVGNAVAMDPLHLVAQRSPKRCASDRSEISASIAVCF